MKRIGIYGGSFNPIHFGHLIAAQSVLENFKLDKIVFIPNGYNPFKSNLNKKERENCLRMLKESISDNPHFEIDTIEINQKGKKFTYDTVSELKKNEPNSIFYFIVGSDILVDLSKWYKIEDLLKSVNFIVVNRHNKVNTINKIKELNKNFNSNIQFLDIPEIEISSTLIRNKIKSKQSIKYLTPENVIKIIEDKEIYIDNKKYKKLIKKIKQFLKKNLKPSRYKHSLNVMKTAMDLALIYNSDINKAQLAGLLHDCAKSLSTDELIKFAKENNISIPKDNLKNPSTLHAFIGPFFAQEKFNIQDEEVLSAISKHTTGAKNMSKLDKIIYLADYIEPLRKGDYIEQVRDLAKIDLNQAVLKSMENTYNYLKENNKYINKNTIDALESLKNLNNE